VSYITFIMIIPSFQSGAFTVPSDLDLRAPAITVWHGLYNRFETGLLPRESVADTAIVSLEHIGVLESRLAAIQTVSLDSLPT
jgi:hypothetical protein